VKTILAPMAVRPVDQIQLGDAGQLLFVGSNTAPNVEGLRWFLECVWPDILLQEPQTRLDVVGTVCAAVSANPKGVTLRGLVDDLAPFYASAGIVISPLRQGSGLKIKLVEALRFGKAAVVTSTTLQGVEAMLGAAVRRADTPEAFCDAIVHLQRDPAARAVLAQAALDAAVQFLSPEVCHADFRNWLQEDAVSVT
jgi:succinoglycan biosynthesis protein ExoO